MKVVGIVESRMSSRRLPGKNLEPILGRPMVSRLVERLRRARTLDAICVATSMDPSDQVLEDWARAELKQKQTELKLSDEIVKAIEDHICSLTA